MTLAEFWRAPIRRIFSARAASSQDEHRSAEFVAKAHRLLRGRQKPSSEASSLVLSNLKLARIGIDAASKKSGRIQRWAVTAQNELLEAQARGDDLLRELHLLEGDS